MGASRCSGHVMNGQPQAPFTVSSLQSSVPTATSRTVADWRCKVAVWTPVRPARRPLSTWVARVPSDVTPDTAIWSRSWRLETHPTSRLGLGYLCHVPRCYFAKISLNKRIKGTEYFTDFLSLREQGVWAWSRLHVITPYNLKLCIIIIIIIINGRENKVRLQSL